jgi:hypothetical protein
MCEQCEKYKKIIGELQEKLRGEHGSKEFYNGRAAALGAQVEQQNRTIDQLLQTVRETNKKGQ